LSPEFEVNVTTRTVGEILNQTEDENNETPKFDLVVVDSLVKSLISKHRENNEDDDDDDLLLLNEEKDLLPFSQEIQVDLLLRKMPLDLRHSPPLPAATDLFLELAVSRSRHRRTFSFSESEMLAAHPVVDLLLRHVGRRFYFSVAALVDRSEIALPVLAAVDDRLAVIADPTAANDLDRALAADSSEPLKDPKSDVRRDRRIVRLADPFWCCPGH
jgi:hypothetical protein